MPPKKPLTPVKQRALNRVVESKSRLGEADATLELQIRQEQQARLLDLEMRLAISVREALEAGVTKADIGLVGLGTKDPHTVYKWLARTKGMTALASAGLDSFGWENEARGLIWVKFKNFPTRSAAEDYPEVLEGMVQFSGAGYKVIEDASDVELEDGAILPGHLRWEIEHGKPEDEGSLAFALDAWRKEQE